ncbi:hypothetical protein FND50_21315 [Rhodococcus sp. WB9]|uniref:hypothetical protein n=1 Tax=Rhodococcus sp. WB9 TaxID=2594007 RepID=UPI001184ED93|nr:hypothetical protein [Rhodococcus sp. WB9]QDQ93042.1 hypothetical protein FND50_21315 [Rhodococcus sp. WB9]
MFSRTPAQRAVDTALRNGALPPGAPTQVWGPLLADKRATLARMRTITLILAVTIWLMLSIATVVSIAEGSATLASYLRSAVSMITIAALPLAFGYHLRKVDRLASQLRPR